MLGWEYPPFISGGLGTACRGLTEAMKQLQIRILFVLPRSIENPPRADSEDDGDESRERPNGDGPSTLVRPGGFVELAPVPSELTSPYQTAIAQPASQSDRHHEVVERLKKSKTGREKESSVQVVGVGAEDGYDGDLMGKIHAYADRCVRPDAARAVRRHPRARLDDVSRGDGDRGVLRQTDHRPYPRHRVRPLGRVGKSSRLQHRTARDARGGEGHRGIRENEADHRGPVRSAGVESRRRPQRDRFRAARSSGRASPDAGKGRALPRADHAAEGPGVLHPCRGSGGGAGEKR